MTVSSIFKKALATTMLALLSGLFTFFTTISPAFADTPEGQTIIEAPKSVNVGETLRLQNNQTTFETGEQELSFLENCRQNPEECNPAGNFLAYIINILIGVIGSFSFLMVVIGGFFILTSAGDENRMNKGKEIVTYAIIGLVVSLSAYFIVAFVQSLVFET